MPLAPAFRERMRWKMALPVGPGVRGMYFVMNLSFSFMYLEALLQGS
ncbi:Uncharacterized protein APZ42_014366 [Daphnia magna]|uniref:Uncharacterized protein n=1 Tax=Daphnia magna TaxID=35525 RepID=A0A162PYP8_9CRUS|nr:Uncharacterized protein APZ42_014366 [Daphnia magna]